MSKAQIRKLETILGKLENLEQVVLDREINEWIHAGKNELLRALNLAEAHLRTKND